MNRSFARLRWQLTFSHLLATAFTLVSMLAAVMLGAAFFWNAQTDQTREPVQEARMVARSLGGLVEAGAGQAELSLILQAVARGDLALLPAYGPQAGHFGDGVASGLQAGSIAILGPDGQTIANSGPPSSGPSAQAPIVNARGQTIGSVVVTRSEAEPVRGFDLRLLLAFFGVATIGILCAASLFALASSSVVAYLLSRRLVERLERLGRAAEALAAGDLSQRVDDDRADELGQLGRQFNRMAADLERSLADLRAERDRVTGLLEQRRQLVASTSHELRTPIATVRGYLESALDSLAPGDRARAELEIMERELERLQRLIDDLFSLSQAEVGRLALRVEPTDVGAVVNRLVATTAPLAWRQRRVQVLAEVAPNVPPACADAERLEQIVSNLLGNATRHTPPGGLVAAAVSAEDGSVRLEVRDTGEGISAADLPRVFDRFYRGTGAPQRAGAGLGLALVKELAEAMGGSVDACSAAGEGSTFVVRLRRADVYDSG